MEAYAAVVDTNGADCLNAVVYCGDIKRTAIHVEEAFACFAFGIGLDAVVAAVYGNGAAEDRNAVVTLECMILSAYVDGSAYEFKVVAGVDTVMEVGGYGKGTVAVNRKVILAEYAGVRSLVAGVGVGLAVD